MCIVLIRWEELKKNMCLPPCDRFRRMFSPIDIPSSASKNNLKCLLLRKCFILVVSLALFICMIIMWIPGNLDTVNSTSWGNHRYIYIIYIYKVTSYLSATDASNSVPPPILNPLPVIRSKSVTEESPQIFSGRSNSDYLVLSGQQHHYFQLVSLGSIWIQMDPISVIKWVDILTFGIPITRLQLL